VLSLLGVDFWSGCDIIGQNDLLFYVDFIRLLKEILEVFFSNLINFKIMKEIKKIFVHDEECDSALVGKLIEILGDEDYEIKAITNLSKVKKASLFFIQSGLIKIGSLEKVKKKNQFCKIIAITRGDKNIEEANHKPHVHEGVNKERILSPDQKDEQWLLGLISE
jgi:hypothetical protein